MIRYISFDLDGTLASEEIDKQIWNEEIPKLYSEKNDISLDEAKTIVYAEYFRGLWIEKVPRWTSITYWFERLGLDGVEELLEKLQKFAHVYPDTIETLEYLKRKYKLIIISNAEHEFLDRKLEEENLRQHFTHVFSGASDFRLTKDDPALFQKVLDRLEISPHAMIHIGNEKNPDFVIPRCVGIKSFLIDRKKKSNDPDVLNSLSELKEML